MEGVVVVVVVVGVVVQVPSSPSVDDVVSFSSPCS